MRRLEPSYERGMLTNGPLVARARSAHRRTPRRRARRRAQLVHVGPHARRAGAHRRSTRARSCCRASRSRRRRTRSRGTVARRASSSACPTRSRSIADARGAHARRRERDHGDARVRCAVRPAPARRARPASTASRWCSTPRTRSARASIGVPVGSFGIAEVFSLTPTKPLVAGEGGLVATNDAQLAETLRIGRDYGNPGDYDTRFAGLNARMSEFHAAMALESLDRLRRVARAPPLPRQPLPRLPRRRARHRVPGVLGTRHEHVQGPHDQGRRRRVRARPRRPRARAARRRRRHPQVLRPAGAPPARVRAPRAHATCRSPTRSPRACCRCRCSPTSRRARRAGLRRSSARAHDHAVELDAYVSTMTEVDARIFELD